MDPVNILVGGWTNPSEKYASQNGFIFPNFRGENKNSFELPPPSKYTSPSPMDAEPWVLPQPKWILTSSGSEPVGRLPMTFWLVSEASQVFYGFGRNRDP